MYSRKWMQEALSWIYPLGCNMLQPSYLAWAIEPPKYIYIYIFLRLLPSSNPTWLVRKSSIQFNGFPDKASVQVLGFLAMFDDTQNRSAAVSRHLCLCPERCSAHSRVKDSQSQANPGWPTRRLMSTISHHIPHFWKMRKYRKIMWQLPTIIPWFMGHLPGLYCQRVPCQHGILFGTPCGHGTTTDHHDFVLATAATASSNGKQQDPVIPLIAMALSENRVALDPHCITMFP